MSVSSKRRGPRTVLLHRATFTRDFCDPMYSVCQGALVLCTNGRYWYHDGTTWIPKEGLGNTQWIKLFHVQVPCLEDDEFGIIMGLADDHRPLDDTWTRDNIKDALNQFIVVHKKDYSHWPEGEVFKPLTKARMLTQKRDTIEAALDENVERGRRKRKGIEKGTYASKDRRRQLIS